MKDLKSFKQFLNEFELEGEVYKKPLWNGKDYLDGDGNINLENMNLTELPCIFPEVWDEGFYCSSNQLISLHGSPKEVGGNFWCDNNKLASLEGAPVKVGSDFDCSRNGLTSLEGAPEEVGDNFYCDNNKLASLIGAPKIIHGFFSCEDNKRPFTEADVRKVSQVGGNIYA